MNPESFNTLEGIYSSEQSLSSGSYSLDYYSERESTNRRKATLYGLAAFLLYFGFFAALMALLSFEQPAVDEDSYYSGTILVSFGEDLSGSGAAARGGARESLLTQRESEVKMQTESGQQPVERAVNSRALFPGTDSSSHDLNQGQDVGGGAQSSNQNGIEEAADGNSESLSGNFSLEGRKLIGDLPLPDYDTDAHGRVVISITVDENGRVSMARVDPVRSTTNSTILIDAARRAALSAQFSSSTEFLASGTITYIFRMN